MIMIKIGTIVGDRYEILDRIGVGGMAEVYKGKDHKLNRFIAVKVLKEEFRDNEAFVKKFKEEARAAAGLAHPNIVNVYDVGDENGIYYIVMELVEGITLKHYIERKGRLTIKEATSIAIQVSAGLEVAHNNQIVHRDIKPQNIIISREGKVKVTDFGIAKAATSQTTTSTAMGSVHYASPEQARGGYVDYRSDIYSLGVVLYEMVTGRVPFDGDTAVTVAVKHLQEELVPPSRYYKEIPYSLEQIIKKCMEKSPDRRYQDIEDLLADLKQSLMDPDGDFVKAIDLDTQARTQVMRRSDSDQVRGSRRVKASVPDEDEEEDEDDDEEDDDEALNPTVEKAMTIAGVVLALIIVVVVLMLVANMLGLRGKDSKEPEEQQTQEEPEEPSDEDEEKGNTVEVPNLLGHSMTEAKIELESLGLNLHSKGSEHSDEYKAGQIIEQDVESGKRVTVGTTIEVVTAGAGSGPGSSGPSGSGTGSGSQNGTSTQDDNKVKVPNVVGKSESDAKSALEAAGLKAGTVSETTSDTVAAGLVVSQSVAKDSSVSKGTPVNLVVSSGPAKVKVTDVIGHESSRAQGELAADGFKVEVKEEYSASVRSGLVISTNPDRGTMAGPGSTVTITVSKGIQQITIPAVRVNMTFEQAKEELRKAGFTGDVVEHNEYSTSVGQGYVTRYSPSSKVDVDGEVTIYVSLGPQTPPQTETQPPTE